MEEAWKDVVGFEGEYQISNLGRLKHFSKKGWNILKNTNKKGWYFNVILVGKSKTKSIKIHRLVAEAFIPNPENKPCINHKDGNKQNNCVDNLEWATQKENIEHARRTGLWHYNSPYRELKVAQYDLNHNLIAIFKSCAFAGKETGICARNILQVANRTPFNSKGSTRKQAGGYIWEFI